MARNKKSRKLSKNRAKKPMEWDFALRMIKLTAAKPKLRPISLMFLVGVCLGLRLADIRKITRADIIRRKYKRKSSKTGKTEYRKIPNKFYKELREIGMDLDTMPEYPLDRIDANKQFGYTYISKILQRKCIETGMTPEQAEEINTHSLRKTFATHFYNTGGKTDQTLLILSDYLNHESVEDTKRYIGLYDGMVDEILKNF